MLKLIYFLPDWSLIFGMNDKLISWAVNLITRAVLGKLRGSITIHFNDGEIVNSKTEFYEKPFEKSS